ncbi:hypothetical protein [Halobacterium noricense]|uniref:hypothetical protein n=1 Tax=Halobacterium noricense TaxID=223182 RepID=UPI001E5C05C8|nr:hypothetical protein [Halobacterium noricense]UHH25674.1 hypothetical protein LT974_01770 [Halobacterium noricense]
MYKRKRGRKCGEYSFKLREFKHIIRAKFTPSKRSTPKSMILAVKRAEKLLYLRGILAEEEIGYRDY